MGRPLRVKNELYSGREGQLQAYWSQIDETTSHLCVRNDSDEIAAVRQNELLGFATDSDDDKIMGRYSV